MLMRIMLLGDSITAGVEFIDNLPNCDKGGYRTHLWRRAATDNLCIDFVGSQCDGPADIAPKHEGHPGWTALQLLGKAAKWSKEYAPHACLVMAGTNDIIKDQDLGIATQRIKSLVDEILSVQPKTYMGVASIPPLKWSDSRNHLEPFVLAYNSEIKNMICALNQERGKAQFADIHSCMEGIHLIGTHPSPAGYERIAEVWYPVLKGFVKQWVQMDRRAPFAP